MPRQEIYRILYALEEFGLVEKTINRPLRFRGIPFKQGISFLLKQKMRETTQIKRQAEEIIAFHQINNRSKIQESKIWWGRSMTP